MTWSNSLDLFSFSVYIPFFFFFIYSCSFWLVSCFLCIFFRPSSSVFWFVVFFSLAVLLLLFFSLLKNFCTGQCLCEFETSLSLILYDTHSRLITIKYIIWVSICEADKKPDCQTMNWMSNEKTNAGRANKERERDTLREKELPRHNKKSKKNDWRKQVSL